MYRLFSDISGCIQTALNFMLLMLLVMTIYTLMVFCLKILVVVVG